MRRNPLQLTTGSLTVAELSTALIFLVQEMYNLYLCKGYLRLESGGQPLPVSSNLLTLSPFLDERKILCVGGRLRHSNLPAQQKHPILIPNNHSICDLIIKHYHVLYLHTAIHLEIVSNLSTEAFIGSLKRFISRRGRPSDIFSDNGTNFVGANNEFRKILKRLFKRESSEKFEDFLASESIQWHFNPPAAPHFGGLWEAGVKSLKSHLKRVVGNNILTHEEFFTLVTQVEAVLNSRPLCSLSEDPNDDLALTPAHFLTGSPLTSLPDPDFKGIPMNRLRRWELVQKE
ncbi:integrase catalytic domain-containing protein [Trichonephila clavipes]|nr:integrase catalytic domain-containing protein [Trichonephila clavipes]